MEVKIALAECDKCPLVLAKFVPPEYNGSGVLFIAEAPGKTETEQGKPLCGDAGMELQRILKDIGKVRADANYTNVALCRSTRNIDGRVLNRTPTPEEYGCCYNRLVAEVKKADPIVIVSLGGTAYCALTGTKPEELKMNKIVGVPFKWLEYDVIPTYHPTFVLYNGGEKTIKGNAIRTQIKMDIQHALTILKTPKQLRLF